MAPRKPRAGRGGPDRGRPTATSSGPGDLSRVIEAPASAVYSLLTDATRRGWAPVPVMRVLSALAPRFVRLALPDGTIVGIAIARQGNARCSVSIELSVIPSGVDPMTVRNSWRQALAAMADQLDHDWG